MNILNLFRRKAQTTPRPTFQAMYARDYARPVVVTPKSYQELMDLHRFVGVACADRRVSTDYVFTNDLKIMMQILENANERLFKEGQVAPTVNRIITANVVRWRPVLEPKPQVTLFSRVFNQAWGIN